MNQPVRSMVSAALRVGAAVSLFAAASLAQATTISATVITDTPLDLKIEWVGTGLNDGIYNHTIDNPSPSLVNWSIGSTSASDFVMMRRGVLSWGSDFEFNDIKHITAPHASDIIPGTAWSSSFNLIYTGGAHNGIDSDWVSHPASHRDIYTLTYSYVSPSDLNVTLTGQHSVPVPAAVWLMGSGLAALFGVGRRRGASA